MKTLLNHAFTLLTCVGLGLAAVKCTEAVTVISDQDRAVHETPGLSFEPSR